MSSLIDNVTSQLTSIALNPAYHDILAIVKGARNGLVYGAKVRFPHALVMTLLFHGDRPWRKRVEFVYKATKQHSLNLMKFVSIYKTALLVQRSLNRGKERGADTFFAGLVGGWIVFGERNAVNEQIILYVLSRVVTSFLPRASPSPSSSSSRPPTTPSATKAVPPTPPVSTSLTPKAGSSAPAGVSGRKPLPTPPGYPYPRSLPPDSKVFEVVAALTWGAVMWLFAKKRERLQGGMVNSMQYLYLDSEVWSELRNLIWHNK